MPDLLYSSHFSVCPYCILSGHAGLFNPNTVNKASTYWIISNLFMALAFGSGFSGDRVEK